MKTLRWFAFFFVFLIFGFDGVRLARGAEYPYDDDNITIEEEAPVAVDVSLPVDSTKPEGVKFVAPEKGTYRISITGGAFCYLPQDTESWALYGGWSTLLHYYVNQTIQWGEPDQWGKHPVNFTGTVGAGNRLATVAKAEAEGQGASVTVALDKGDSIWFLVSDGLSYYSDNSGIVTVRITGP